MAHRCHSEKKLKGKKKKEKRIAHRCHSEKKPKQNNNKKKRARPISAIDQNAFRRIYRHGCQRSTLGQV